MHSYLQQQLLLVCFLNMNYYYHFCIHNLKRWHAHLILRLAEKCNNVSNFFVDLHILLRLPFLLRMRDFCLLGFCNTLLVVLCAAAAAVLYQVAADGLLSNRLTHLQVHSGVMLTCAHQRNSFVTGSKEASACRTAFDE